MKRNSILFLVMTFLLAAVVRSQTAPSNCSIATYQIAYVTVPSKAGCSGPWGYAPGGDSYTQTMTLHVEGYQTQTGVVYASAYLPLVQIGHCWVMLNGYVKDCNPLYTVVKTTPLKATGYNYDMLSFQSLDGVQATGTTCGISYGARQFWQCLAEPCTIIHTSSPIVVDVSGKGFFLTDAKDGVLFDIEGTGELKQMGWTARGAQNAFLALPGPDGLVHSGRELFGNFTPQPASDHQNGFAALAVYDENHDGVIDARDPVFGLLRLWIDANHDGVSQPEELHTLTELGVNSISLKYHDDRWHDQYGNVFRYKAAINDGTRDKWTYDVFFVSQ